MKQYSRVLAGVAMAAFVLAAMSVVTGAPQAPDTSTAAKTKRKSRKAKTADTAAPASTAAPAAPATTPPPAKAASKTPAPVANASASDIAAAKAAGKVWVNTDTGIYHKRGRWYCKTKQGKFMSEDEAKKAGYHEAKAEIGAKKT